jgi:hypothetical protein
MNERPSRRHVDYGDFTEYQVRCLIAEYCKNVTLGTTGWGVSFKDWVELKGIAKHDGMFRLISLSHEEMCDVAIKNQNDEQ